MRFRRRIYLDFAAAAPVVPEARHAFLRALRVFGNPSSAHDEGRNAKRILEEARLNIARLSGVKREHVIFTSGATEANALAIEGWVRAFTASGRPITSARLMYHQGAHASVVRVMERLSREGASVEQIPTKEGVIDVEALIAQNASSISFISLEAVSPETGMRHDTRAVRTALSRAGSPAILHVDASQLPLIESCVRERLGADLVTLDAQKIGGIRGIGCLIRSANASLSPLFLGGSQEGGLRSGTEAPALAAAFSAALMCASRRHGAFAQKAFSMRTRLIARILNIVPDAVILGGTSVAPHILTFALLSKDTDYLQALLNEAGYAVGTKSACESDSAEGSRMALTETGDESLSRSTLRISWGPVTKESDLVGFARAFLRAIRFLDERAV